MRIIIWGCCHPLLLWLPSNVKMDPRNSPNLSSMTISATAQTPLTSLVLPILLFHTSRFKYGRNCSPSLPTFSLSLSAPFFRFWFTSPETSSYKCSFCIIDLAAGLLLAFLGFDVSSELIISTIAINECLWVMLVVKFCRDLRLSEWQILLQESWTYFSLSVFF